jgi:hypothetical protein
MSAGDYAQSGLLLKYGPIALNTHCYDRRARKHNFAIMAKISPVCHGQPCMAASACVSAHTIYAPLLPLSGSASVRDGEKVNDARHLSPPPTDRAYPLSDRCRCFTAWYKAFRRSQRAHQNSGMGHQHLDSYFNLCK